MEQRPRGGEFPAEVVETSDPKLKKAGEPSDRSQAPRSSRAGLRLADTPVRLFEQSYYELLRTGNVERKTVARLRQYFRLHARRAAEEGVPVQRVLTVARSAHQSAATQFADPDGREAREAVLFHAVDALVRGYVQGFALREQLDRRIRDNALELLEEERRRLARELHDETGQILTATLFKIDMCLSELPTNPTTLAAQLQEIRETLLSAARDIHRLVYSLRPPMLSELGLVPTLRWLVRQFELQFKVSAKLEAPENFRFPDAVETAVFRIVQEALNNVAKHARAQSVSVKLQIVNRQLVLVVRDDGQGFRKESRPGDGTPHLGLLGMRERARQLGGQLTITTAPHQGTTLLVTLPLQGELHG